MISAVNPRLPLNGNKTIGSTQLAISKFKNMKKSLQYIIVLCLLITHCILPVSAKSQNDSIQKHKIAVFAPLYLDSAFNTANEYRYAKNVFPSYINSGLEFYQGVQLALDSLSLEGAPLEVYFYDTRSAKETLEQQLARPELDDVELIIAHCSNNEIRTFSNAALTKKIPVINVTIPNDAGIYSNPYFVILNPTLKTQCEGIYEYVKKNFPGSPIVVFRKRGRTDDIIKILFDDYSRSITSMPLQMQYVELNDSFTVNQLTAHLDSTKKTLCIAGSLDINFGKRLTYQLASVNSLYPAVVMGMPTWDAIKEFSQPEFKGTEIIYSTPFFNNRADTISEGITEYFNSQMYARPSDMVFRGYEVMWKFAKLLMRYGSDISSNLSNRGSHIFTEYNIQPVINKNTMTLDYFENKKLYFVHWIDGVPKAD
jgi:hypothetical protein